MQCVYVLRGIWITWNLRWSVTFNSAGMRWPHNVGSIQPCTHNSSHGYFHYTTISCTISQLILSFYCMYCTEGLRFLLPCSSRCRACVRKNVEEDHAFLINSMPGGTSERLEQFKVDEGTTFRRLRRLVEVKSNRRYRLLPPHATVHTVVVEVSLVVQK